MKISSLKQQTIKLGIFAVVLGYMALDLWCFKGPIHGCLHPEKEGEGGTPTAVVYGEAITEEQLARYTAERNLLAGKTGTETYPRASMQMAMVRELLLRIRTRYNDKHLPELAEVKENEMQRLSSRYADEAAFDAALASQGYTRRTFAAKMQARLREQIHLERAIREYSDVSDEAVTAHYNQLREEMTVPASRHLSHIFLASLDKNPDEVRRQAEEILQQLQEGADFAELARTRSEDERSAPLGGNLDVIYDDGTFPLPELILFGEEAIPANTPVLAQSRWGWHILLAGEIEPAGIPSEEECRDSLRTAIISAQRELATNAWFKAAVKEGFQQKRIKINVNK